MKLVEIFKGLAGESEQKLGNLALRQEANLRRREALKQIEERFRQMAADGYIDDGELDALMRDLTAQGLDAESLEALHDELKGRDSTVRADDGSKFEELFETMIGDAVDETRDNQSDLNFGIQMHTADASNYTFAASQLSKKEQEVYMNIIANMKA